MVSKREPTHFTGLPSLLRGEHQRAVLGVGLRADAEAAADVVRVDADLARPARR